MKIPKVVGCVAGAAASMAETAILMEVEGARPRVRSARQGGALRQATPSAANEQDQGTHEMQVSLCERSLI